MLEILVALVAFLFGLCLIISLHELGHFLFAKKFNILCYEYSIGMGPLIYGKKKGETQYGVRAIPLGGYVAMADAAMGNEMLKIGEEIALDLDNNVVKRIIFSLTEDLKCDVRGKIVSRDIDSMNGEDLFIEVDDGEKTVKYEVSREAVLVEGKKEMQVAPYDRSFDSKKIWQRFLTLFAGPGMNFVLAFFLFIIVGFASGKPSNKNVIGSITKSFEINGVTYGGPAYSQGINANDKILEINGIKIEKWDQVSVINDEIKKNETIEIKYLSTTTNEEKTVNVNPVVYIGNIGVIGNFAEDKYDADSNLIDGALIYVYTTKAKQGGLVDKDIITKIDDVEIHSWTDLIKYCTVDNQEEISKGKKVNITVVRDGETKTINDYNLLSKKTVEGIKDLTYINAKMGVNPNYHFDFIYGLANGFRGIGNSVKSVWNTLRLLFTSKDVGVKDLSGPVGIYSLVKNSLLGGAINYIYFLGFLSVNIGIVNLLPIPALDGGRIVFLGYELVTRKKVNKKVENMVTNIMFFLLLALFVYITFNDVIRLFK